MITSDEFINKIFQGLELLGWQFGSEFTSEDTMQLVTIAEKAIELNENNCLTLDVREALSLEAYNILSFQLMGIQSRADSVSTLYVNCPHLSPLIALVDEASFAFYRGYFTSALAMFLIVLERYLRSVYKSDTDRTNPTFWHLKQHILSFQNEQIANIAYKIVNTVYSKYNTESPSAYEFNRHGLLHGLRGISQYDEMNCARIYQVLDIFCDARGINRTCWGDCLDYFKIRYSVYRSCSKNQAEQRLLLLPNMDYGKYE